METARWDLLKGDPDSLREGADRLIEVRIAVIKGSYFRTLTTDHLKEGADRLIQLPATVYSEMDNKCIFFIRK